MNRPSKLNQPLFQHIYLLADELSQATHRFIQSRSTSAASHHLSKPLQTYRVDPN